jgi:hypothetical protein
MVRSRRCIGGSCFDDKKFREKLVAEGFCQVMSQNSKLPHNIMRNIVAILFFVATIVLLCDPKKENTSFAQNTKDTTNASRPEMASVNDGLAKKVEKASLVREGTVLKSQHVVFRISNDRVILTMTTGTERYICLENLNLQRITDVLKDNPTLTDWTVDFIVTEYRGMNYVLIQRAVLSSAAQRESDQK